MPNDAAGVYATRSGRFPCDAAQGGDVERRKKKRCPLLSDPLDECYVTEMDSQLIEKALYFCGGHYEQCEIYRRWLQSHDPEDGWKGRV